MRAALLFAFTACSSISPMSYTNGVPNLSQVDDNIWRSGQITTQAGWNYINQIAAGRHVHLIKLNFDIAYLKYQGGYDVLGVLQFRYNHFPRQ